MQNHLLFGALLGSLLLAACAPQAKEPEFSKDRIAAHVKYLSSDELEGRGPATAGEKLATDYIAKQFAEAGAKEAGDNGSFFQSVPLVAVETLPETSVSFAVAGKPVEVKYLDDYTITNQQQQPEATIDADAIFVGHGINAPEFQWNDYKSVDIKGKIAVLFTNEPPSDDPAFFGGKALTYYGRWVFKYEEAARQGALGVIIVHTDETAGYPWQVVRNSGGIPRPFVKLADGAQELAAAGWVTSAVGEQLFAGTGKSVADLLALANSKDFQPLPLKVRVKARIVSRVNPFETRNVVAKIEGSDPAKKNEAIIYTAHWDHLGVGFDVNGDKIYNGAADNATGCGVLLEMAHAFGQLEPKPARTILFAAVSAEEGGLRGSEYYAHHPVIPVGKTALNINFDTLPPLGLSGSVSLLGYERMTAKPVIDEVAKQFQLVIEPDNHPEQGFFYRSDHFSLAKVGIPAFSVKLGTKIVGKPDSVAEAEYANYVAKRYHQPSDEFDPSWDFSGLAQITQFGFEMGRRVANLPDLPTWNAGDEFLAAREKSMGEAK